jgi:hypothetical protein
MILPDGYSDVPAGKIAAVVTHLEMTDRPALAPGPEGKWTLRRVAHPGLDWFRGLYRRIGEEWLWFARIRMSDLDLAAKIHSPLVEVYALVDQGCDEGLLELDFRQSDACEIVMFGVTSKTDRQRRRPLADEPRAGAGMVAGGYPRLVAHLFVRSSGGTGILPAVRFPPVPAPDRSISRPAP